MEAKEELEASKRELTTSKRELDKEKERYGELMDESVEIGCWAMLMVRADLFREYREGKANE